MRRQFDDGKVAFADGLLQLVIADAHQSVDRVVRIGRARHRRRSRCHFPPTAAVAGTMLNACYFSSYCGHSVDFLDSRVSDEASWCRPLVFSPVSNHFLSSTPKADSPSATFLKTHTNHKSVLACCRCAHSPSSWYHPPLLMLNTLALAFANVEWSTLRQYQPHSVTNIKS